MAVNEDGSITRLEDWYAERQLNDREVLTHMTLQPCVRPIQQMYDHHRREMDMRMKGREDLEKLANNEVVNARPDRPNISSGETAGIVLRIAKNTVQNAPNVEIISRIDDDSLGGVVADYTLRSKILHYDTYANDLRTRLQATLKAGLTIGFDCVIPVLSQKPNGEWWMQYDSIHYRDVFPEPGAVDVREATTVFVRRYLTKGMVRALIKAETPGWDIPALRAMLEPHWQHAPMRRQESSSRSDNRRGVVSEGFEVVTLYTNTGDPFLTFEPKTMCLLRIEKNLHPNKEHPVFFYIPEWDHQNPLGKSLVERLQGRQDFQDMFFNGAAKIWELSVDPPILAYGAPRAVLNLGPGKANRIDNPNARVEAFEKSTNTLMQYAMISQNNFGNMVNLSGSADQQMAVQAGGGMSATPQGVEAQEALVDITTNDYQKSLELFIGQYASYALTVWFQEMKGMKRVVLSADARRKLINAGWVESEDEEGNVTRVNIVEDEIQEDGSVELDFSTLATEYFVKCVPGSMTEMEDEKQVRILREMFIPLSQALPAIAQTQDQDMIKNAAATMQYIIQKTLELSGSAFSEDLKSLLTSGPAAGFDASNKRIDAIEQELGGATQGIIETLSNTASAMQAMRQQIDGLAQAQELLMDQLGVPKTPSTSGQSDIDLSGMQALQPTEYNSSNVNQGAAQPIER